MSKWANFSAARGTVIMGLDGSLNIKVVYKVVNFSQQIAKKHQVENTLGKKIHISLGILVNSYKFCTVWRISTDFTHFSAFLHVFFCIFLCAHFFRLKAGPVLTFKTFCNFFCRLKEKSPIGCILLDLAEGQNPTSLYPW